MSFHQHKTPYNGILPREGFHADVLGSLIKRTVLNPVLTGALLLYSYYTLHGRQTAFLHQGKHRVLKVLTALGVLRVVNAWLSRRAVNNGVTDKTYDWNKEVVLVTGGSDGIGKEITLMLASRGIKVAILDVQEPTYTSRKHCRFDTVDKLGLFTLFFQTLTLGDF